MPTKLVKNYHNKRFTVQTSVFVDPTFPCPLGSGSCRYSLVLHVKNTVHDRFLYQKPIYNKTQRELMTHKYNNSVFINCNLLSFYTLKKRIFLHTVKILTIL